jgi:xylulokinase
LTEVVLGLDIGSSSTKGVLATLDGTVVATAEAAHAMDFPHPGWAEHDPQQVWWQDFLAVCRDLLTEASHEVVAVAISGIGPCLLPVDGSGDPLRPAIMYGIDIRAQKEIDELTERFGFERVLARCGSPLTSQAVGPKMLWLRHEEPEVWSRTKRFLMAHTFVILRLTGEYVLDHHSASQCCPLYSIKDAGWIDEWCTDIAPGVEFPRLAWSSEVVGTVTAEASSLTGLPAGIPVVAGTIDAWAEALSVGVAAPEDFMLMYGTTMFMVEIMPELIPTPQFWGTKGVFAGTHTLAGGLAAAGALTAWLREIAGDSPYAQLVAEAAAACPGARGLVALPYFSGERTPIFDTKARGVIAGLTLSHTRGELYRALLESTAFAVRHNLEAMEVTGARPDAIVAVGGGTKGGLWTQIVSDVTGQVQGLPSESIGACYGDALLAAIGLGAASETTRWNAISEWVQPDERRRAFYDELYGLYRDLYVTTKRCTHALADVQDRQQ